MVRRCGVFFNIVSCDLRFRLPFFLTAFRGISSLRPFRGLLLFSLVGAFALNLRLFLVFRTQCKPVCVCVCLMGRLRLR